MTTLHTESASALAPEVARDARVLARFVEVYCHKQHRDRGRAPLRLKAIDLAALRGRQVVLCAECRRLLAHGLVMRQRCPHDPKPLCKHCPDPCYAPGHRQAMRKVMRYAGRRLVLTGRLHYLWHLLS